MLLRSRAAPAAWLILLAASAGAEAHEGHESLVAAGAEVEPVASGFRFTEGPACDAEGNLFFTDIPNLRIHRRSTAGELVVAAENTGGANGLYFDREQNLHVCEGAGKRVIRVSPIGGVTVLAERFGGAPLNRPNDLWVDPGGGVYFTDPGPRDGSGATQDGNHVYYVPPGADEVRRVVDDLARPNGVLGTPDGRTLYVADMGGGKTWRYAIGPDGGLSEAAVFAEQGSDGLARDEDGNLYLTGEDGVSIYSSGGEKLATIAVPEKPSNMTFCGVDRKILFITARTGLYALRMNVAGQ